MSAQPIPVLPPTASDPADYQPFPLTATQEAYLVGRTAGMEYGSIGCHGYWEWQSPTARPEALTAAWREVVDRHPALRTVIREDGTQQVLESPPPWNITINDLRDMSPQAAEDSLNDLRASLSHKVFDPFTFPLWDVQVSLLPDGGQRIHFSLDLLVADAWSYFQVLVPELALSYEGTPLPAPPERTFRQHVVEAQAAQADSPWQAARDYWGERLEHLPGAPTLPAPRSRSETTEFERLDASLPKEQWEALKTAAARRSVTPTVFVAGVFAEVLRAWGAGDDFVINLPVFSAGRAAQDTAGVVGDFTSTILLEVDGSGTTFADRCSALQRQLWKDLPHANYSGVHVARALARQRGNLDVGFPVVLTSLLGQPPRRFHTALGDAVYVSTQTPQVSLDFQVSEVDSALTWSWDFRRSAFPDGLMEAMFGAFGSLLQDLAENADLLDADAFDLMPPEQRENRARVNDTSGPVPDVCLHTPLADTTRDRGDTVAVIDSRAGRISARELDAVAGSVAAKLADVADRGVVAVLLDKGWRQLAAAHGVTRQGHAYLPMDPEQPFHRLQAVAAASGASVIVTEAALADTAAQLRTEEGTPLRQVLIGPDARAQAGDSAVVRDVSSTQPAYVIYTSGSTGVPKGVQVPHRGAVNAFAHMNELLSVDENDRCLAVSGLHFDLSVYDVFGMFMAGGSVVIPDPERAQDPSHWLDLVQRHGVTVWNSAPALFELLVDAAERTGRQLPSLRAVVLAGDWIPVDLPSRAQAVAPGVRVVASGGPAETCVWSIHNPLPSGFQTSAASIPYGWPMRNQRYRIVDDRGRDVPDWVSGEMCVESDVGLADGYLGLPELTTRKFSPLPGSSTPAYRTGDVGRFLPDGSIEFLGRADFQVKVSGVRIELGEVEAALREHHRVKDAVVVASSTQPATLSAFVLAAPPREGEAAGGDAGLEADLSLHVGARVPRAAVPARVTVLDQWPLSANGKVDRLALRKVADTPVTSSTSDVLTDPVEVVLAELWSECIESRPDLGRRDNYFVAGGSSMGAIRAASVFAHLTGVDVSAKLVFLHPTVQDCAQALRTSHDAPRIIAACEAIAAA